MDIIYATLLFFGNIYHWRYELMIFVMGVTVWIAAKTLLGKILIDNNEEQLIWKYGNIK